MHSKEGAKTVSIKAGCLVSDDIKWKEAVHIWCKRAVVDIPEGVERWDGEPGVKE